MLKGRIKYFLAAITSTAMWGFFSIPLRNLKEYPSDEILHYRIFTSAIITLLIILLFKRSKIRQDISYYRARDRKSKRNILWLMLAAGILITANWFSFIFVVNHVSLKAAAFAYMVCPIITALGGFFLLKEPLSALKFTAIGIALISIIILATGSFVEVLWSVFVAALYAFYLIIQRVLVQLDKLNMLGVQLILSILIMLPYFLYRSLPFPTDMYFWINILIISVVFTIVPLFLSLYSLIGLPSSTLGIIIYINPVVSFAVAFLYFNEQVTGIQVMAYSLLLIAVIVFNWGLIRSVFQKYRPGQKEETA